METIVVVQQRERLHSLAKNRQKGGTGWLGVIAP